MTNSFEASNIYSMKLSNINGINFTEREIDVIACFINNRSAKKISSLLKISNKTVNTHIRNVKLKLLCFSKDGIIDFFEKSGVYYCLKEYYVHLLIESNFNNVLVKIASFIKLPIQCNLIFDFNSNTEYERKSLPKFKKNLMYILQSIGIIITSNNLPTTPSILVDYNSESNISYSIILLNNDKTVILDSKDTEASNSTFYLRILLAINHIVKDTAVDKLVRDFEQECKNIFQLLENSTSNLEKVTNKISILSQKNIYLVSLIFLVAVLAINLLQKEVNKRDTLLFNIPRQDQKFIGRKDLISELDYKLEKDLNKLGNHIVLCAYTGLGGIGKTQLALNYIRNTKRKYILKAWFPSEDKDLLLKKYIELAKQLGYSDTNFSKTKIINFVKNYLETNPGWIIVYDNVDNYQDIKDFLPEKGGHIIITTRQRIWPNSFQILSIDVMSDNDSLNLLGELLERKIDNELHYAKDLIKLLGNLPLALAQAGAYIKQCGITISEYIKLYKEHELDMLETRSLSEDIEHDPVAVTWDISINKIIKSDNNHKTDPLALEILTICSYLSPDRISKNILHSWLKHTHPEITNTELVLNSNIELLWKYSMINFVDSNSISIHRLVQAVLRNNLREGFYNKSKFGIELGLSWFEKLLQFFIENENNFKLTNSFNQIIETSERLKKKFKGIYNTQLAYLDLVIAPVYFYMEKYDQYKQILDKVDRYLKTKKGEEFLKCKILYLYSAYYRKKSDFSTAESIINTALQKFQKIDSTSSISKLEIGNLKAKILFNKGNITFAKSKSATPVQNQELKTSIELVKKAIEIFKDIDETRDRLRSIELLGRLLIMDNKSQLVISEFDNYSDDFENIADTRTRMLFYLTYSDAYKKISNYKESLIFLNKALKLAENMNLKKEQENILKRIKEIENTQD